MRHECNSSNAICKKKVLLSKERDSNRLKGGYLKDTDGLHLDQFKNGQKGDHDHPPGGLIPERGYGRPCFFFLFEEGREFLESSLPR